MKRLLWLIPLLTSCTTAHVPPDTRIRDAQRRIIARDLGFVYDTIIVLRFDMPFSFPFLKAQMEECSGRKRAGMPRLFEANKAPLPGGHLAEYRSDANAIVFALGSVVHSGIVRHELLHFLLSPETGHPPEYFSLDPTIGRCAAYLHFEA